MGLFLRNQDPRSELQTRIAAELQERLKEQAKIEQEKTEPAFLENQHHTRLAGVVIAAAVIIAIAIIFLILVMNQ